MGNDVVRMVETSNDDEDDQRQREREEKENERLYQKAQASIEELYIDDRDARTVCFAYKPTPVEGVRAIVDGILAGQLARRRIIEAKKEGRRKKK